VLLTLAILAHANPSIEIDPAGVWFGVQPFGSSTLEEFAIRNTGDGAVTIAVETVEVGDDFSPGQTSSTCPLTSETVLEPGEECVHVVGFQPSEFFGGYEEARMRVVATSAEGDVVRREVKLAGRGFEGSEADADRFVDFSAHPEGPLRDRHLDREGVHLLDGEFVGFVQGEKALIGPVSLRVLNGPRAVSMRFAPSVQGAAWYSLTASDAAGNVVASERILVVQDEGTTNSGPFGYVEIGLDDLPFGTDVIALDNEFVTSSFPGIDTIGFAVAEIALLADPTR
jgi:hypothetical protein